MLDDILKLLTRLVAHDTRNPPRQIAADGIFATLVEALPGFTHTLTDYGAGAITLLSVRGAPKRVYNFHLDTVPAAAGWSTDPHGLVVRDGRAYGLGACDIKGAAAAMAVVAQRTRGDLALLFSSDEEANDPRCIRGFLATQHGFTEAVVAEPTQAQARVMHRGIVSAHARFGGIAGHASERRALADSAVHRAVGWANAALTFARSRQAERFEELEGLPFNLGRIDGGIKGNVIADACEVRFGFRPLPAQSVDALLATFRGMAPPAELVAFDELFRGPPLPAAHGDAAVAQLAAARVLASRLGLPVGPAVNFWTEASLFSEAGLTALVFGPGDIAQAHTADEWVALEQLETVARHYQRILASGC
jgi:acetylornithine deacetylase